MTRLQAIPQILKSLTRISSVFLAITACQSLPPTEDDTPAISSMVYPPSASPTEIAKFIKDLNFDWKYPEDLHRITFEEYKCPDPACADRSVTFLVVPERHARKANWATIINGAPTTPGVVVAEYRLIDQVEIPSLGLKPGGVLYHWIGKIHDNDARGSALISIDPTSGVATLKQPSRNISSCTFDEDENKPSQAVRNMKHPANVPCLPIPNNSPQLPSATGGERLRKGRT